MERQSHCTATLALAVAQEASSALRQETTSREHTGTELHILERQALSSCPATSVTSARESNTQRAVRNNRGVNPKVVDGTVLHADHDGSQTFSLVVNNEIEHEAPDDEEEVALCHVKVAPGTLNLPASTFSSTRRASINCSKVVRSKACVGKDKFPYLECPTQAMNPS